MYPADGQQRPNGQHDQASRGVRRDVYPATDHVE